MCECETKGRGRVFALRELKNIPPNQMKVCSGLVGYFLLFAFAHIHSFVLHAGEQDFFLSRRCQCAAQTSDANDVNTAYICLDFFLYRN